MSYRRHQFSVGEWYHCYSRGVDKRTTFESTENYERFLQGLYLSNSSGTTDRNNFAHATHEQILSLSRLQSIVGIGAYSLMPNHFHLLLKEIIPGGITKFMHKLGTSYTMYFNAKNERTGNLFVKPFRSRHVADDRYFQKVAQYIHLNAAELFDDGWKRGAARDLRSLEKQIRQYRFSSLPDYESSLGTRAEKAILDSEALVLLSETSSPLSSLIREATEYYGSLQY